MDFFNLNDPVNVGSGISDRLLLAPLSFFEVDGIMKPEPPFMYYGQKVVILDSHIFKANKGFLTFYLPPDLNSFSSNTIGDIGFQKFDQSARCFLAGSYAEQHEMMAGLLNVPLIVLVEDSECDAGLWYQLGTADVPAYLRADFGTGTATSGNKGYDVLLEATNDSVKIYAGAIEAFDEDDQVPYLGKEEEDGAILTEDGFKILL